MYSEHSTHSNYINVPYRLAKRYRKDKAGWDLLVFAICLKLNRNDSGMYLRSPKELMKILHCSYRKAVRLFNQAPHNKSLFRYNPRTKFIVARSFEIGCNTNPSKGKREFVYRSDDVIVVTKNTDGRISHNDISSQLRDLFIKKMLRTQKPADELQCQGNHHSATRKPLTQKFIGNCVGVCQTTVSRRLRKMSANGEIKITRHPKIPVIDLEHGIVMNDFSNRKYFISGRFAYIRDVNDYEILNDEIHFRFKHLIYNHKKRRRENRIIRFPHEL